MCRPDDRLDGESATGTALATQVQACRGRWLGSLRLSGQDLDSVCNVLSRLAKLPESPVGCIAFGDVVGACMVDQPLGQRGRQHQLALGDGDETVAQAVGPELGAARLAIAGIEMVGVRDMMRFSFAVSKRLLVPATGSTGLGLAANLQTAGHDQAE